VTPRAGATSAAALLLACSSSPPVAVTQAPSHGAPIDFAYGTPSGETLTSSGTRGRATAILFVTTFDLPSQLMAERLDSVVRRHTPRANAGAVALEAPNSAPLVEVFKSSLNLSYPVALANTTGLDNPTPFGHVDKVPTLVVLDRRGREVSRALGVISERDIDEELTRAAH
jgi:hypothetical protein